MRNFEERKAEVFRRSVNRINKRKKIHSQIFTLSLALCFLFALGAVKFLPVKKHGNVNIASDSQFSDTSTENNGNELIIILKVIGNNSTKNLTENDTNKINDFYSTVNSAFKNNKETLNKTNEATDFSYSEDSLQSSSSYYEFIFITDKGEIKTFILNGSYLIDKNTNKKVLLKEKQYSDISFQLKSITEKDR